MNAILWIIQVLLAVAFLVAGLMRLAQPIEKLAAQMGWVRDFRPSTVRLIGALEMLAAIGLILPPFVDVLPWLVPLAAVGLGALMLGAAATHLRRKETGVIAANVVLLTLAVLVAVWPLRRRPLSSALRAGRYIPPLRTGGHGYGLGMTFVANYRRRRGAILGAAVSNCSTTGI
jgi:uncharacterized membrane protein YphA (DoxX/SURF4 family)